METIQDDSRLLRVTAETHRRVMTLAGKLQVQRGERVSADTVVTLALDVAEADILHSDLSNEPAHV